MPFIDVDGQVEGRAFVDANGNGTREPDEKGVPDLRLTLDGTQARTNDDGLYRFPPVEPGTYELSIDARPATLQPSSSMPKRVSLEAGERRRVNIPLVPVASIRATVFNDADEDGTQDPDETGFGGVRIRAVGPDDATRAKRTPSSGTVTFGGLTPGTWRVVVATGTLPENVELTTGGETTVDVGPGEQAEVAFGAVERAPEVRFSPTADFTVRPSEPRVGEAVEFDGSASFDPDGTVETFEWDLDGDGAVDATGERVETVYERADTFEVTLTVTDDDGLTGSLTRTIEVASR
ncbi:MAG: SdrD B-like domain-containing protein [Candidatus Bipolaricaulia bacterium]